MNKKGSWGLNQRLEPWIRNYDLEVTIRCASLVGVVQAPMVGLLHEKYNTVSEVVGVSCLLGDLCIMAGM